MLVLIMKKVLAATIITGILLSLTAFGAMLKDYNSNSHGFVVNSDDLTSFLDQQRDIQRNNLLSMDHFGTSP